MIFSILLIISMIISWSNACNTTMDCSLNGECVHGLCQCDSAWVGKNCEKLEILPMYSHSGYHNMTAGASWGGLPIFVDGKWHLFVAQMVNNCSLEYWGTNSEIIRAESPTPGGPYIFKETVIPAFAHNPTIRIANDGTFLLYMIGNGVSLETPVNCTGNPTAGDHKRLRNRNGGSGDIHIAHSTSIYGPWDIVPVVFTNPNASRVLDCSWTNPSPVILDDDSVLMAFTAGYCHQGVEAVGLAQASHWKGPYSIKTLDPILPKPSFCLSYQQYEDPFLWQSSRGFHILFHGMCPTGIINSKYAYSQDGVRWTLSPTDPYSYFVEYEDGSEKFFIRCERPQLLFNGQGKAIYLFNGVQPILGHSYTIARPLT